MGAQPASVTAVDEIGNSFSYRQFGSEWRADTYHSFANDAVRTRLEQTASGTFELRRVFGTRLVYEKAKTKVNAAGSQSETYYRLALVEDRNGNALACEYLQGFHPDRDGDLLVAAVYERAHPERRLKFGYQDVGIDPQTGDLGLRLASVEDPLGRVTSYAYSSQHASPQTAHGLLRHVQRPEVLDSSMQPPGRRRPTSSFAYYGDRLPTDDHHVQNLFVAPAVIEDARGHRTRFTYVTESFPVAIGRVQVHFQTRPRVATLSCADGTALLETLERTVERVHTSATDTSGAVAEYDFRSERVVANNELGAAVFVTSFDRISPGIGSARFFSVIEPSDLSSKWSAMSRRLGSASTIWSGSATCCIRAATLVVSPTAV
jgi:hypothetical protein